MYRHLDDPAAREADGQLLTQVLQRAERIRARTRRRLAIATVSLAAVVVALAAVVVAVRPDGDAANSRLASSTFNQKADPLASGTPVPTTSLLDVVFVGRSDGFGLADHRNQMVLATTTDGGDDWMVVNGHLPAKLAATTADAQMEFTSDTVGYLWRGASTGGSGAPMWVTDDGGATWTSAPLGTAVYDVSAIGANVWALDRACTPAGTHCQVLLDESTDAGVSWQAAPVAVTVVLPPTRGSSEVPIVQLARVSTERAYVYSSTPTHPPALVYTTDGGATWMTLSATLPCVGTYGAGGELALSSTQDLWLVCGGAASGGSQAKAVWRSSDAGGHWAEVAATPAASAGHPPSPGATGAVTTASPTTAATATGPGAAKPVIGTLPLQGYVAPYSIGHKTLAVLSATDAWLFPTGGAVSATTDGGSTWSTVPGLQTADFGSGGAGNITFIDANHGWAVEFGVGLWRTADAVGWEPAGS